MRLDCMPGDISKLSFEASGVMTPPIYGAFCWVTDHRLVFIRPPRKRFSSVAHRVHWRRRGAPTRNPSPDPSQVLPARHHR